MGFRPGADRAAQGGQGTRRPVYRKSGDSLRVGAQDVGELAFRLDRDPTGPASRWEGRARDRGSAGRCRR
ncbi:MAG: hypothetical protein MZU84_09390 [Sphingobacterium sp.]|nr:hypothetical protein [Sphingobacterium sp.]